MTTPIAYCFISTAIDITLLILNEIKLRRLCQKFHMDRAMIDETNLIQAIKDSLKVSRHKEATTMFKTCEIDISTSNPNMGLFRITHDYLITLTFVNKVLQIELPRSEFTEEEIRFHIQKHMHDVLGSKIRESIHQYNDSLGMYLRKQPRELLFAQWSIDDFIWDESNNRILDLSKKWNEENNSLQLAENISLVIILYYYLCILSYFIFDIYQLSGDYWIYLFDVNVNRKVAYKSIYILFMTDSNLTEYNNQDINKSRSDYLIGWSLDNMSHLCRLGIIWAILVTEVLISMPVSIGLSIPYIWMLIPIAFVRYYLLYGVKIKLLLMNISLILISLTGQMGYYLIIHHDSYVDSIINIFLHRQTIRADVTSTLDLVSSIF